MYKGFCKDYPVISIEDPFDQDDSEHVTKFTAEGVCQVPGLPPHPKHEAALCWITLLRACTRNSGQHEHRRMLYGLRVIGSCSLARSSQ